MKLNRLWKQFNWRFLLVRILVNAIALAVTVAIVPKIDFVDPSIRSLLFMAIMLGVLNALVKPLLQFLTLQFIFVTFGLVLVIVNALILMLLSLLFPNQFAVSSIWWALLGGLVLGLVSSFFESLLGLTMPVVPDEPDALRRHVEAQAPSDNRTSLAAGKSTVPRRVGEVGVTVPEGDAQEPDAAAESGTEPEPVVEAAPDDSGPPVEGLAAEEATSPDGTDPRYQPQEEAEEDRS
jgi:putative membrane protein